ncbi:MAG: hypothetical protein HY587_03955 [Candidatus Omnitrophica bacterium]|nr:hypothetical protein [Candidatus Omnitrophota bacterium]
MAPTAKNRMRPPGIRRIKRNPLKQTALLYLREALLGENYETCAELIEFAKEFGADRFEIESLLEDPRRMPSL